MFRAGAVVRCDAPSAMPSTVQGLSLISERGATPHVYWIKHRRVALVLEPLALIPSIPSAAVRTFTPMCSRPHEHKEGLESRPWTDSLVEKQRETHASTCPRDHIVFNSHPLGFHAARILGGVWGGLFACASFLTHPNLHLIPFSLPPIPARCVAWQCRALAPPHSCFQARSPL